MGPSAHMVLAQRRQIRLILKALCVNPGTFLCTITTATGLTEGIGQGSEIPRLTKQ